MRVSEAHPPIALVSDRWVPLPAHQTGAACCLSSRRSGTFADRIVPDPQLGGQEPFGPPSSISFPPSNNGKPTARKAEFPSGEKMAHQAKAAGRKATGNRADRRLMPLPERALTWARVVVNETERKLQERTAG